MLAKKVTALLVSAALVLALLAGCGGGQQSVARTLLNLLDGKYTNVSVEMDSELEADLRQVLRENEADDLAAIRAALETLLGSTVSFRYLGDGQQGDTTFDLVFYAGTDPDKAAQAAYTQWNSTFSTLPDDGQYTARLALVQTENGCFALVKATVDKAGTPDKPDPEPEKPKDPYTQNTDGSYTVNTPDGLQKLFAEKKDDFNEKTVIKLTAGTEYTVDTSTAPLAETFKGTLTSEGGKAQITLSGAGGYGLFKQIETGGTVENIRINVKDNISQGYNDNNYIQVGAVAGYNKGAITGCHVNLTGNSIETNTSSYTYAGGIVGVNENEITDCTVTGGTISAEGFTAYAGGIAGYNEDGTIEGSCKVDGTSVSATSTGSHAHAGGLVGESNSPFESSTVNGCYTGNGTISATSTRGFAHAGGLVGNNIGTVTGSYTGSGAITAITESTGSVYAARAGGLVGNNSGGTVSASYNGSGTISAESTSGFAAARAGGLVGYNNLSGTVNGTYSGSDQIEAKAGNNIASVPEAEGEDTDNNPNTDTNGNASAGTGIGYDETKWGPVAATELP